MRIYRPLNNIICAYCSILCRRNDLLGTFISIILINYSSCTAVDVMYIIKVSTYKMESLNM